MGAAEGRIAGKRAVVFGAGSIGEGWGNGKASAVLYAREGAEVACVDVNPDAAAATAAIITEGGGRAIALTADVTHVDAVRAAVGAASDALGGIDILHNNVGANAAGGAVDTDPEDWDRILRLNLTSAFLTSQATLPIMEASGGGSIVNVSSLAAIRYLGFRYASYYASKAGLNHLTRTTALEFADRNIRANAVMPGLIDTPHIDVAMAGHYADRDAMRAERAARSPMGRMGTAWDVAHAALFLASDEAAFITGVALAVDGGMHARC